MTALTLLRTIDSSYDNNLSFFHQRNMHVATDDETISNLLSEIAVASSSAGLLRRFSYHGQN